MNRTRFEKPAAIQFPAAPEHSKFNPELQYRLDFLRFFNRGLSEAVDEQQTSSTCAWQKAAAWSHEWILRGMRDSIDEIGPLSSAAQKAAQNEFIKSLEAGDTPKEAA